jgi:hypothetical protein
MIRHVARAIKKRKKPAQQHGTSQQSTEKSSLSEEKELNVFDLNEDDVERRWADVKLAPTIKSILTVSPTIIAVTKLIGAANGDSQTMLALLRNLNIIALMTVTLLSYAALIPIAILIILLDQGAVGNRPSIFTASALGVVAASISLAMGVLWWVVLTLLAAHIIGLLGGWRLRAWILLSPATLISVVFVGISVLQLQAQVTWLPTESITLSEGKSETVYILADDNDGLTVLQLNSRVAFISGKDIVNREFCRIANANSGSILKQGVSQSTPKCPASSPP